MARGRQPGLCIRMRDAQSGELLRGGSIRIATSDGEDMTGAYKAPFSYFSDECPLVGDDGAPVADERGVPVMRKTPYGRYMIVVVEPGRFSQADAPDHDPPADPVEFTFDASSAGYVDVFCPAKPGAQEELSDEAVETRAERAALDKGLLVPAIYIAATALAAILAASALAPAIYMTLYGLASIGSLGLSQGLRWGFSNLSWYIGGGYLPFGWPAVAALWGAFGLGAHEAIRAIVSLAASMGLVAYAYVRAGRAYEDKVLVRSDLLDGLPPAADSSVGGSGGLVRSLEAIRSELPTYDPSSGEKPAEAGIFVGFVDGPMRRTAPAKAAYAARWAAWRLGCAAASRKAPKGGLFPSAPKLPDAPEPPSETKRYVMLPGFLNTLLLGDTRAGKTRRILLATIDLIARAGQSMLIIDPKGELYALMHEWLESLLGPENVNRVDFRCTERSKKWNPMQPIVDAAGAGRAGSYRRDGSGIVLGDMDRMSSAASDFVEMLLPHELDVGNSSYFNKGARSVIASVACYVASIQSGCPDDERCPATVASVIDRYVRPRQKKGAKPGEMWTPYKEMLKRLPHDHPAVTQFGTGDGAKDNDLSSFCTTALTVLQDFRDSSIAKLTSRTDVPLSRLGRVPSVMFAIIPHEKQTYGALASLFLQQSYQALVDEGVRSGEQGKLRVPVTFICEELGQLPPIPNLDGKLTVSLGAGIRWLLVFQSCSQIVTKYEEAPASTIYGNCSYKILLKTQDARYTGEWMQKDLGTYTVESGSKSRSKGPFSILPQNVSSSSSLTKREVLMPSEVAQWTADIGSLVTLGGTAGPYVVPLPDVSQTPTGAAIRINDRANVSRLYREAFSNGLPAFDESMSWDPCLGQIDPTRTYTEEDFRIAEKQFLNSLLNGGSSGKKGGGKGERAGDGESGQDGGGEGKQSAGEPFAVAFVRRISPRIAGPFAIPSDPDAARGAIETLREEYPADEWDYVGEDARGRLKPLARIEEEARKKLDSNKTKEAGRIKRLEQDAAHRAKQSQQQPAKRPKHAKEPIASDEPPSLEAFSGDAPQTSSRRTC